MIMELFYVDTKGYIFCLISFFLSKNYVTWLYAYAIYNNINIELY